MEGSVTPTSNEPKVNRNVADLVSRVNPKYHFPGSLKTLEHQLRICFGLPFKGKQGGTTAYAYTYDKASDTYIPDVEVFKYLWECRRYLYSSSLRDVAAWLNFKAEKVGYKQRISHMGLRHLMVMRPPYEQVLLPVIEREKLIEYICLTNSLL